MDTVKFKLKLEEERQKLEAELSRIGQRNPSNPDDWEPTFTSSNPQTSSSDEMADKFEQMEQTLALQNAYEDRLKTVNAALARIDNGTYGKCPTCGKDMSLERMEADPAATCACGQG